MSLDDLIEADLSSVFFNTEDFAKTASVSRAAVTITPTVIMAKQEVKTRDAEGFEIARNWVVIKVPVSHYDFGGGVVEPSAIDEFTVSGRKYEPQTPKGVEQCWDYSDGTSLEYMIYVEEVAA